MLIGADSVLATRLLLLPLLLLLLLPSGLVLLLWLGLCVCMN
jgi:hypothetical protein